MNSKGNTIVEAVIVLPLVVLSIITIITAMIFFLKTNYNYSNGNMGLLNAMGEDTKTFKLRENVEIGDISKKVNNFRPTYYYEDSLYMEPFGLIKIEKRQKVDSYIYKINEKRTIRNIDFIEGVIK
ncbi:MAG: hypothetical protein RSB99_03230 [Bacilli bacterium]